MLREEWLHPGLCGLQPERKLDFRGREFSTAMAALEARSYRNATLLFNLMRVFLLANPDVAALINPPWLGTSEWMPGPAQVRHRSAYYDAFFCEALMDFLGSGLAARRESDSTRKAIASMIRFCLVTSCERVRAPRGDEAVTAITAIVRTISPRPNNAFDAASALLALAKLGGEPRMVAPALDRIAMSFGEGRFGAP